MRFIYTYRNSSNERESIDLRRWNARIFVARPIGRINPGIARRYPRPIAFRTSDGRWFLSENPRKGDANRLDPNDIMRWFYLLEASAANIREIDDNALDLARSELAAVVEPEQPEILIKEANRVIAQSEFLDSTRSQEDVLSTLGTLSNDAWKSHVQDDDIRLVRIHYTLITEGLTVDSIVAAASEQFLSVEVFGRIDYCSDYLYLVVRDKITRPFIKNKLIKMAKDVMADLEIAGLVDVFEEPLRITSEQRDRELIRRLFGWVFEVSKIRATGVRPRVRSIAFEWAGEGGWLSAEELDDSLFESIKRAATVVIRDIKEATDFDDTPLFSPTKFEPMWSNPTIEYWAELKGLRTRGGDSLDFLYGSEFWGECKEGDLDFEEEYCEPPQIEDAPRMRMSPKLDDQEPLLISPSDQTRPFLPIRLGSNEVSPALPVPQQIASNDTRTIYLPNGEPHPLTEKPKNPSNGNNPERDARIVNDYKSGLTYKQIRDRLDTGDQLTLSTPQAISNVLKRRAGEKWAEWQAKHEANAAKSKPKEGSTRLSR